MFVTNIRYGELPVRKVYLGEKLVWQCIDVRGDAQSTSYTKAYFYMPTISSLVGEARSVSSCPSNMNVLELQLVHGESVSTSYSDSTLNLFNLLLAVGASDSKPQTDAVGRFLEALLISSSADSESADGAFCRVFISGDMKSQVDSKFYSSAIAFAPRFDAVNGDSAAQLSTRSTGWAINIRDISSKIESYFSTSVVAGCIIPTRLKAFADSISWGSGTLQVVDAILMNGGASTTSHAEAICKLFDLLSMGGTAKSCSDTDAFIILNKALSGNGDVYTSTHMDSFIGKYLLVSGESEADSNSYESAPLILWYPPIGDGVPLVANDGVDITVNGNILEIQQAYQIIIDDENGILEVV